MSEDRIDSGCYESISTPAAFSAALCGFFALPGSRRMMAEQGSRLIFGSRKLAQMRAPLMVFAECRQDLDAALASGADGLIFDLSPAGSTDMAKVRRSAVAAVRYARERHPAPSIYVRVGALESATIEADLDAIMPARPDGIVLAVAQCGADVQHLGVKLAVREAENGIADGQTKIIAMAAATPPAIFHLGSFVDASPRLAGLIDAPAERAAALGCVERDSSRAVPPSASAVARSLMLFAAKAAGVLAIDAASPAADTAALRRDCERARCEGFDAKLAGNPSQIATIRDVFGSSMFEQS